MPDNFNMKDYDDPLDLLDDDGNGILEMCLLEEEEKKRKIGGNNNPSGCCFVLILIGASLLSPWIVL
jgi:hypothetical protein